MPLYDFENIETGEVKEVYLSMKGEIVFNGESGDEIGKWRRVYSVPQVNMSGLSYDIYDSKSFAAKTETWKDGGSIGDLVDMSKEFSEKRAAKEGLDPIKEKAMKKYEKERHGVPHPDRKIKPKKSKTSGGSFTFG